MVACISVFITFLIIALIIVGVEKYQNSKVQNLVEGKPVNNHALLKYSFIFGILLSVLMGMIGQDIQCAITAMIIILVPLLPAAFIIELASPVTKKQVQQYNKILEEEELRKEELNKQKEKEDLQTENELLELKYQNRQLKDAINKYWICPFCDTKNDNHNAKCSCCLAPKNK